MEAADNSAASEPPHPTTSPLGRGSPTPRQSDPSVIPGASACLLYQSDAPAHIAAIFIGLEAGGMDAVGCELLVALSGIAGDADSADDLAIGVADQQAAGFGKQLLVARRDQITHEDRPLLGALMHQARAAAERKRRIGFAERHLETDHRRAVFFLEGFHLAARLDHDDADPPGVELT